MIEFLDQYGNMNPNSRDVDSENPSLFNVEYYFLKDDVARIDYWSQDWIDLHALIFAKRATNGGKYKTNEYDDNDSLSLDESIAIAAASNYFDMYSNLDNLKFTWQTIRPDVFWFIALCKYPVLNILIFPRLIVSLKMLYSCNRPVEETSGKCLAYVMQKGLNMKITWWLCLKLFDPVEAFGIYFPEENHPINEKAREVFSEQ